MLERQLRHTLDLLSKTYDQVELCNNTATVDKVIATNFADIGFTLPLESRIIKNIEYEYARKSTKSHAKTILKNYISLLDQLIVELNRFQKNVNKALPDLPNAMEIKLQDQCSFDSFISTLSDIDYLVNNCSVVYQLNEKEEAVIETVSQGSILFYVVLSQAALAVVGKMVKIGFDIREEKRKQKEFMLYVDKMNAKESFEKIARGHIKDLMYSYSKALLKESTTAFTPEDVNNLAIGIDKISNLIDSGVGFYPTLGSSNEVVESFPDKVDMDSLVQTVLEEMEAAKNKTLLSDTTTSE